MSNGNSNHSGDGVDERRRRVLAAMGATGTAGLAGCGGNDGDGSGDGASTTTGGGGTSAGTGDGSSDSDTSTSDGGDGSSDQFFEDRAFVTYTPELEDGAQKFNRYVHRTQMPRFVYPFMYAQKVSEDQETADLIPQIVTEWEHVDETEVRFQFRDDSAWNVANPDDPDDVRGTPVKPSDWGIPLRLARWPDASPEQIKQSEEGPQTAFEAITKVEWDDDEGVLRMISEPGWFSKFDMQGAIRGSTLGFNHPANQSVGVTLSIMARDFQDLHDEVKDMAWEDRQEPIAQEKERLGNLQRSDLQEAQNIPCSGPFVLEEIREDKILLSKNEEYFNADKINWQTVEVQIIPNNEARIQALQNNVLDGINGRATKPNPETVDALPDNLERYNHSGSATSGLVMNVQVNEYLGDPKVRQAFMFVLNKPQIAEVKNRYASRPPEHPPGTLNPEMRSYVEEANLLDSFEQYEQNLDRAASLMQEAGFEKNGSSWVQPDGKPFELSLTTGSPTVQVESTIIAQLNQFGVNVSLEKVEPTVGDQRMGDGDFELGISTWWGDHRGFWYRMVQQSDRRHRFGSIFSDERVQEFADQYDNVENKEYDWTMNLEGTAPEQMKEFTLEAPPVGEWDSDERVEYPVWFYDHSLGLNLDAETRAEYNRKLCWVWNWYLPMLTFAQDFEMAFQDQEEWDAPTEEREWRQDLPTFKLIQQGRIQATE